jgi:hypothetical protein
MFTLPSVPNLIISTIIFIVAVRYANRALDIRGTPSGTTRSLSVFAVAYLLSWGGGELVDWSMGTTTVAQASGGLSQAKQ